MSNSKEMEEIHDDYQAEIDDDELEANDNVFSGPAKGLMPELSLEKEISEVDIQQAIEKFSRNFSDVYPSSGPVLYIGSLDLAIKQSVFDSDEPRPLLIYLHRNGTAVTHLFCKNVLCNEEIINYLAKHYLVWAWDCTKDANYHRLLLMLLQHAGASVTAMLAAIDFDDFPLLLCLLSEGNQVIAIRVIEDRDKATSLDETYIRLIEIQNEFDCRSKQKFPDQNQNVSVGSYKEWFPSQSELAFLDQQTEEFQNIAKYFTEGPGRIIHVERIINERWGTEYKEKKKFIDNSHGSDQTEQILFHGCLRETAQKILRQGFQHEHISIHGTNYGHGFYFSSNPIRSHIYALPDLSSRGERTMLVCRVLIGRTCRGDSDMKNCPLAYHSTTDGSQIYVVFSNLQILPEYLVTYK